MVNTGRIHREFRNFHEIFYSLVQSDEKLMEAIGENGILRK